MISIPQAIENGDLDTFSTLVGKDESLRNGPNTFGSWLHLASYEGHLSIVKYLVENGADVNLCGNTADSAPIEKAAAGGHLEVIDFLIKHGARLDVSTPNRNPMFSAICDGHIAVARFLLEAGIDRHVVYRSVTGKLKNSLSFARWRAARKKSPIC